MNKCIYPFVDNADRPIIKFMGMDTLIDSGAEISVFNALQAVFELIFPFRSKQTYTIKGFGGDCSGTAYSVSRIEDDKIIMENVPVFVPEAAMNDKYKLILATPAFRASGINVSLDHVHDTVSFDW